MIHDLSLTLKAILDEPALTPRFPELADALIVFDRPSEPFSPSHTTVDLFLYDIRENLELRDNEPTFIRTNGQVTRRRPPVRVACSYLVTAWPMPAVAADATLREHRLLSQVLQVLSGFRTIPAAYLKDKLVGQEPPLPLLTAQPDSLQRSSEFWTALGNKLRPSVTVTATIALEVFAPETAPLVISRATSLEDRGLPATHEPFFRIGGRVTGALGAPVANATVTLVQSGVATRTDAAGLYTLGILAAGTYTLRAQSGAVTQDVSIAVPPTTGSNYNVQLPP
jgi:Pvc16 N-terminal domain/Carboxypeptidase regulatory-like domain